ncbi:hypothetical protein SAMN05421547_13253 [Delftia lacustris]|uniref:Uncharacterized protein n=1 Tax=Delftia lacustris TaxID=558537 RepID=A0A1H3TTN9_9BURK|nr:hypothetical protein SAMN05421547_13253 [Delftia lacustris]
MNSRLHLKKCLGAWSCLGPLGSDGLRDVGRGETPRAAWFDYQRILIERSVAMAPKYRGLIGFVKNKGVGQ